MKIIEDRYDGITIGGTSLPETIEELETGINQLIETYQQKKLLWVKIPAEQSEFIPVLTKLGFQFHHCNAQSLMLVKKLSEDSFVPTATNSIVGVGAIVRDGNQLLVVRDRFSTGYKLPGGHIDNNETIKDALKREVYEETGVSVEFESIMNLGHFTRGQFEESNLYIVCTARALSKEITIHDSAEVVEAKWIDVDTFLNAPDTNNYNRSVVRAALSNNELKLTDQPVKLRIKGEVFY